MSSSQALPFASIPRHELEKRIAAGVPPSSAEEYLARVRLEADCFPEVMSGEVDPAKLAVNPQTPYMPVSRHAREVRAAAAKAS